CKGSNPPQPVIPAKAGIQPSSSPVIFPDYRVKPDNDKMGRVLTKAAANAVSPHVISETQSDSACQKIQKYSFPLL
ncbi:MAG: hypothetical protein WBQ62_00745, partial [Dehalococcoidales bacterium]